MGIVADDIVKNKKACAKCGSDNLSWGEFDPDKGTPVKCNECGNAVAISHQDYDHPSRKEVIDEELVSVDVTELSLGNEQIDELIGKLNELKETKESISLELDEDNDLVIHYEEDEE